MIFVPPDLLKTHIAALVCKWLCRYYVMETWREDGTPCPPSIIQLSTQSIRDRLTWIVFTQGTPIHCDSLLLCWHEQGIQEQHDLAPSQLVCLYQKMLLCMMSLCIINSHSLFPRIISIGIKINLCMHTLNLEVINVLSSF